MYMILRLSAVLRIVQPKLLSIIHQPILIQTQIQLLPVLLVNSGLEKHVLLVTCPNSGTIPVLLVNLAHPDKIMMSALRDVHHANPSASPLTHALVLPTLTLSQTQHQHQPPPQHQAALQANSGLEAHVLHATYLNSGITPVLPVSHAQLAKTMMSVLKDVLYALLDKPSTLPLILVLHQVQL